MKLHVNTVSDLLWNTLQQLMSMKEFGNFRIVGGTSLSLQLGHRASVDIDLFTDVVYGSLDFELLENKLKETFTYVDAPPLNLGGMGRSYFIGNNENELIKLDLFYTDPFVFPCIHEQGIRFSSIKEVAAMKLEVIAHGGRKKDFWDIHELLETFTIDEMIGFYTKRNPFGYTKEEILTKMTDFAAAENDFTPNCYKEKDWALIKIDIERLVGKCN